MLYGLLPYVSNRYSYATYSYDFYDNKEIICNTCARTKNIIQLRYWPPKITLEGGKRYPDCLYITSPFEDKCGMVLSDRALAAFRKENITGFVSEPITILDNIKNNQDQLLSSMPQYHYIYIKGKISLDYQKMHYRKKNICNECGEYTWSRIKIGESVIDYSTWDKSDLCKLEDYPNYFLCTQRVIDVIKKYKLKGFAKVSERDLFRTLKAEKIC